MVVAVVDLLPAEAVPNSLGEDTLVADSLAGEDPNSLEEDNLLEEGDPNSHLVVVVAVRRFAVVVAAA